MKHLSILTVLVLDAGGCVHYAAIEQVNPGMTVQELLQVDTPCYYRGTKDGEVSYNCQFRVSSNEHLSGSSVKPYILTFKDGKLNEITLNERELYRQQIRDWYYYDPGYYYRYGYPIYPHYPYTY